MAMEDAVALVAALDQHASGSGRTGTRSTRRSPPTRRPGTAAGRPDPGLRATRPVVVGALRPRYQSAAALAVRLPLLQPRRCPSRSYAGATRPSSTSVHRALAGRPRRRRGSAAHPVRRRGPTAARPGDPGRPQQTAPPRAGRPGRCRREPPARRTGTARGRCGSAPRTPRPTCPRPATRSPAGSPAAPRLVAVGDGTPLTRRLVCEAARLDHGAVTMLIEDGGRPRTLRTWRAPRCCPAAPTSSAAPAAGAVPVSRLAPAVRPARASRSSALPGTRDKLGAVMARSLQRLHRAGDGVNPRDADPAAGRFAIRRRSGRSHRGPDRPGRALRARRPRPPGRSPTRRAAGPAPRWSAPAASPRPAVAGVGYQRDLAAAAADGRGGPARAEHLRLPGPAPGGCTPRSCPAPRASRPGRSRSSRPAAGSTTPWPSCSPRPGYGVSLAVGLGNAVDVTAPDVLRYLADDEPTRAVALHVESVPDGPALVAAVRHAHAPASRSSRWSSADTTSPTSPRSHTGALATSWRTTRAALRAGRRGAGRRRASSWSTPWPPCRRSGCRPAR